MTYNIQNKVYSIYLYDFYQRFLTKFKQTEIQHLFENVLYFQGSN